MMPVSAPLNSLPPVAQPQLEAIRRDNARFEAIPEPTGTGAGSRARSQADDYDRNRTGLETREAATRNDAVRPEAGRSDNVRSDNNGSANTARADNSGRVDPDGRNGQNSQGGSSQQNAAGQDPRDRQQQQQIQGQVTELKARDREVRAHEAAHAVVGGQFAGPPSYQYQQGPDGRRYAVGGEVSIDLSTVPDNPQATIRKLETVRAAALAPADPSAQDRQVAARATQMIAEARRQMAVQQQSETRLTIRTTKEADKASLASDSASEAVFGEGSASTAELQSKAGGTLTVYHDAPLRSPCPMCSKPHLSPLRSDASLASDSGVPLTERLRSLGVTGAIYSNNSSRDFRASA